MTDTTKFKNRTSTEWSIYICAKSLEALRPIWGYQVLEEPSEQLEDQKKPLPSQTLGGTDYL